MDDTNHFVNSLHAPDVMLPVKRTYHVLQDHTCHMTNDDTHKEFTIHHKEKQKWEYGNQTVYNYNLSMSQIQIENTNTKSILLFRILRAVASYSYIFRQNIAHRTLIHSVLNHWEHLYTSN